MSNPPIMPLPLPDDDRVAGDGVTEADIERGLTEHDGDVRLDPDLADEAIESAEADRIASGTDPVEKLR